MASILTDILMAVGGLLTTVTLTLGLVALAFGFVPLFIVVLLAGLLYALAAIMFLMFAFVKAKLGGEMYG